MEAVTDFIFLGSKSTTDADWSHEIKTLAPWKKRCDKPRQHIEKQRHYFGNKVLSSQSYGFSSSHVWMIIKEAQHQKTDAFKLCYWRRLLRVPWIAKRSNQSMLKEINPEYSLDGLMLKLKLQYFGHLMWRVDSLEKTLMLGGIEGNRIREWRGWNGWMASPTQWTWVWAAPGDSEGQGCLACCSPWGHKESDTTEQLKNDDRHIRIPSEEIQSDEVHSQYKNVWLNFVS